jgi:homoserine O-acetyltransferase/O-succinyltransferase
MDDALFQENERIAPSAEDVRFFTPENRSYRSYLELGPVLAYRTWGELNTDRSNAVVVCHAISGDSNCVAWWDRIVGPGKAIDPAGNFIICCNALGGCQGTTGPGTLAPDGKPFGSRFPEIGVEDMVDLQVRLVESLGISKLRMVAGGSMGGMQSLEWTRQFPVEKAWITASTGRHSAMQIGFNEVARQAIFRDPRWRGGDYVGGDEPFDGLAVARMLGHLTYLSEHSFERKFGRETKESGQFQVESYLNYQGEKFTQRFDARSLVTLSSAIDRYNFAPDLAHPTRFLITSFASDWIYPSHQSEALALELQNAGYEAVWQELSSPLGHDAFLLDDVEQVALLKDFISSE